MRVRPSVRQICAAVAVVIGGASVVGAPAAVAACGGTPVAVNDYGVCVTTSETTVPAQVVWTPGVGSKSVNTPQVLFVPPQSFGTPYVPPQGVTTPSFKVDAVTVSPCTGSC